MATAGAVRCCCAFQLPACPASQPPLTTAHRQGLEKLGKGSKPRSRLAHHPRPSPVSRIVCSNGHALTGNGQLHMPEPQLQLLRSDNTSTCPGGRVGCRERYALRPVKTRSREVKRERAIARVRCSAESARAPFYKEAPTVPAPRRAHECPMSSAGAVRCCCAFLRARLAPLTTAHRQGLEKLGKGNQAPGPLLTPRARAAQITLHA